MAQVPQKTYSKNQNVICSTTERDKKENIDAFDHLLSSPLKQEVHFEPLSYWDEKLKKLNFTKKKTCRKKYGLYELSDSDDCTSPFKNFKNFKRNYVDLKKERKDNLKNNYKNSKRVPVLEKCSNYLENSESSFITFNKSCDSSIFVTKRRTVNKKFFRGYMDLFKNYNEIQDKSVMPEGFPMINDSSIQCSNGTKRNVELNNSEQNRHNLATKKDYSNILRNEKESLLKESNPIRTIFDFSSIQEGANEQKENYSKKVGEKDNSVHINKAFEKNLLNKETEYLGSRPSVEHFQFYCKDLEYMKTISNNPCIFIGNESDKQYDLKEESSDKYDSLSSGDLSELEIKMSNLRFSNTIVGNTSEENDMNKDPESTYCSCDEDKTTYNEFLTTGKMGDNTVIEDNFRYVNTRKRFNKNKDNNILREVTGNSNLISQDSQLVETDSVTVQSPSPDREQNDSLCSYKTYIEGDKSKEIKVLEMTRNERISTSDFLISSFDCPVFESTRILDDKSNRKINLNKGNGNELSELEITEPFFERPIALMSGKKWRRSMLVLKRIQKGSICCEKSENAIKGRNHENFLQDVVKMQNDTMENEQFYSWLRNTTVFSQISNRSVYQTSNKTLMNYTVKAIESGTPNETASSFRSILGILTDESLIEDTVVLNNTAKEESSVISARDYILAQCGQDDILPFEEYFNERTLENCKKIGEGVYGEVFKCGTDTVLKIIPIEGADKVNGEPQKKFEEIISEIIIAMKLSSLRKEKTYQTSGFSEIKRCWCVVGKYPKFLIDLWNEYDRSGNGSENDSPVMFKSDQLYIILELANGGKDLESFVFTSSKQSLSIFIQTAVSLAIAEKVCEFEHRDLHWGNLLISPTKDKFMTVLINDVLYKIPTNGVKVSIIDFTLSRISHEGCCIFNDLSVDPSLFLSQGDYQFEIYRLMQKEVNNDWSLFKPRNNLYWLHYIVDKMIKLVRYKNKSSQTHKTYIEQLKKLESAILKYNVTMDFVFDQGLI